MGRVVESVRIGAKRHFLRHVYIKCIILPGQARDKHSENSKKRVNAFRIGGMCVPIMSGSWFPSAVEAL
eukprot:COSAG06_NODE_176_length_21031_cov_66.751290_2_plen_69_part_00